MKKFVLCLITVFLAAPALARGDSAWVLPRNSWYVESRGGYGVSVNDRQEAYLFDSHIEVGFLEKATLLLDIPAVTLRTPATETVEDGADILVNNGFTDLFVGSRIALIEEPFALSLNGGFKIPTAYDVSFFPSLGEGQLDVELGLSAGYDFYPLEAYVQGGLGYRLRSPFDESHVLVSAARREGRTLTKPADEVLFHLDGGAWLTERLFAGLNLWGELAIPAAEALAQEQVYVNPVLAYRLNPALDLSLQADVPLFNRNRQALTSVMLGIHLRFGDTLGRSVGLRGSVPDFARYDERL